MSTVTDLESYQQFALQQQAEQRAWSAEQADKQMQFQREMSGSAHQREVADLQAAGLNPVLSAGGSGASVPSGAAGDTDNSAAAYIGNILQQVLQTQSAQSVAQMYTAATIQAAQIAAAASMYGYDMQYQIKEDFPSSMEELLARQTKYIGSKGASDAAKFIDKALDGGNVLTAAAETIKRAAKSSPKVDTMSKFWDFAKANPTYATVISALISTKQTNANKLANAYVKNPAAFMKTLNALIKSGYPKKKNTNILAAFWKLLGL